ncbi:MAG: prepilin peptidase [Deltaproteobacteria bacterium]|nr:prepilin peptidase [Deltaproteobacteria bacterium]
MELDVATAIRTLWLLFGATVGACLGSFANVVVARVPAGESIVHPPSRCPHCGTPIAPWHNIPVASWLALRGRARCCGAPIAARYVVVELAGALLGWSLVLRDGPSAEAVMHGLALLALLCVALIDLEHWIIPPALSLGLIPVGLLGNAWVGWQADASLAGMAGHLLRHSVLGGVAGFLVLWVMRVTSTALLRRTGRLAPDEDAMGSGDEDLLAGVGAVLGPAGVFWTLFLGAAQGAAAGITLRIGRAARGEPEQSVPLPDGWTPPSGSLPFGPFLALAATEFLFLSTYLPSVSLPPWGLLLGLGDGEP